MKKIMLRGLLSAFIGSSFLLGFFSCEVQDTNFIEPRPIALSATNIASTSFVASWTPVIGSSTYFLDVSTDEFFTEFLPGFQGREVSDTTLLIENLNVSQIYYYRVRARRGTTTTSNSNVVSVITALLPAPTILDATDVTSTSFIANWTAVSGANQYVIEWSENMDFSSVNSQILSGTSFTITGLSPATVYFYRVRATDGSNLSGFSNIASQETGAIPAPVARDATEVSPIRFTAVWEPVDGATSYQIDVATDPDFNDILFGYEGLEIEGTETETEIRLFSVRIGKTHYYRVRAISPSSTSGNSEVIEVGSGVGENCRLEQALNPLRINSPNFDYNSSNSLTEIDWSADGVFFGQIHRIVYNQDGQVDRATRALFPGGGQPEVEIDNLQFTYSGEVVSRIEVFNPAGELVSTWSFTYDSRLRITQWERVSASNNARNLEIYEYDDEEKVAWSPSRATDQNGNIIREYTYDDMISPYALIDPNLALFLPVIPNSSWAPESERIPFIPINNIEQAIVSPTGPYSFVYEYNEAGFATSRSGGDNQQNEEYFYDLNCGF